MTATSRNLSCHCFPSRRKIPLGSGWIRNPNFITKLQTLIVGFPRLIIAPKLCVVSFPGYPQVNLGFWLWLCWPRDWLLPGATAFRLNIRPSVLELELLISELLWLLKPIPFVEICPVSSGVRIHRFWGPHLPWTELCPPSPPKFICWSPSSTWDWLWSREIIRVNSGHNGGVLMMGSLCSLSAMWGQASKWLFANQEGALSRTPPAGTLGLHFQPAELK